MMIEKLKNTLTLILAGGVGTRLYPLTKERAKPAVFFGGIYRIIDFTLSNCINSGLRKIHLLTQYRSHSLQIHISKGWHIARPGEFINIVPPQFRVLDTWYRGTADAVFHNIFLLNDEKPENVLILAGDHVYKMDYAKFLAFHVEKNADMTIACVPSPREKATSYGVVETDKNNQIIQFIEKPDDPPGIPGREDSSYVSMGIYVFKTEELVKTISADAKSNSTHDFGRDIIPRMLAGKKRVFAYGFMDEEKKMDAYWRDIGDLDSYYQANMDLCDVDPSFNLYDGRWPIYTHMEVLPPVKTVFADEDETPARAGKALDSLVSPGVIISGGKVVHSVLSPHVRINSYAEVERSVLFHGVTVGRDCKIRNAIIDKDVHIPEGTVIGYDLEKDRKQFTVTENGVVVIPKEYIVQ